MIKSVFVAITGASGSIVAIRLVDELLKLGINVTLSATETGLKVCQFETGIDLNSKDFTNSKKGLEVVSCDDFFYKYASGSTHLDAMVVVPCSMGSLSRIAHASSTNLIERVADVMIKEKRPLVIVPRETPLSLIHLENMTTLTKNQAIILPFMPAFYTKPKTIEDIINFMVDKIFSSLGVKARITPTWEELTLRKSDS